MPSLLLTVYSAVFDTSQIDPAKVYFYIMYRYDTYYEEFSLGATAL